jgi:hypothetical protein
MSLGACGGANPGSGRSGGDGRSGPSWSLSADRLGVLMRMNS